MLLYTWAQWGHYLNGFLNDPVVLDIGEHMVCCLFICLCIFMILLTDFHSIFYLSAVRKRALKYFAYLSGVQNVCILFCLFICTPIYLFFFFFLEQLHITFFIRLSTVLVPFWQ